MTNNFGINIKPIKLKPSDIGFGMLQNETKRDSRRAFNKTQKNEIWAQQNGKCAECHKQLDPRTIEYDHIKPWKDKGKTLTVNGAALCANCHKLKSHSDRLKKVDKTKSKKKDNYFKNLFYNS